MGRVFLDTNILVYADDLAAGEKRRKAQEILHQTISDGVAVLSTQVLQEFFVVATRKLCVDAAIVKQKLELLARLDVVVVDKELILEAIDLHRLNQISFWDALIVRCAAAAGCDTLLTEDLSAGQVLSGVRIENPFADLPDPTASP